MSRILIVEDNENLAFGLRNNLEIAGHEVDVREAGGPGLEVARAWRPDLVVLDLMLPDLDGYRVLRTLRAEGLEMPVLILTARDEEADKVLGFRLGADDYVTKPFGVLELIERVQALLRRSGRAPAPAARVHAFGTILVDEDRRTVTRAGEPVLLTPLEFDLLVALIRRRGAVASRIELLREVWGHEASVLTRTVDTHVAELRRKLEDDAVAPRHVLTARKAGYRFEA
jgi:two-component system, OmpR family, alkaline phosphatase synthesis response regulator PhoP